MLPKNKRVTTELFQKILKEGKSLHTPALSFRYLRETTPDSSRFSVFVPKKVLKLATKRNYLKRKVNSALRSVYPQLRNSFIGVVYAKNTTINLTVTEIAEELKNLFKKSGIL